MDVIDIYSQQEVWKTDCNSAQLAVAWNPKKYILAYTLEEKEKSENIYLAGMKTH